MPKYPAENVPMPRREGLSASILNLSVGQSFLIPTEDLKPNTRRIAHAAAKRLGKPVSILKVDGGLRVYRLKEWPRAGREAKQAPVSEVPMTKDEKLANLRAMISGEIKASPKEIAYEIDNAVPEEDIRDKSYDFG
jgi:hypothetical protein